MKKLLSELVWKRRRGAEVKLRKTSLQMIGQNGHRVVINEKNEVLFDIDHELCQAAKELGWTEVEVYQKAAALHPCG